MRRPKPSTICLILCLLAGGALAWRLAVHAYRQSTPAALPEQEKRDLSSAKEVPFSDGSRPSPEAVGSYFYGFDHESRASGRFPSPATGQHQQAVGLLSSDPRAYNGYTLLAPLQSTNTYLIDMRGRVVHRWTSDCRPALSAYLLENGHLSRTGTLSRGSASFGPGFGGRVQEFSWTGELVWDYKVPANKFRPHHDAIRLPNGNVLMIVLEKKSSSEAIAAGRKQDLLKAGPWQPDALIEVQPTGKTTGKVVWEWHAADHLIQDQDPAGANYGSVVDHPERIDVNYDEGKETTLVADAKQLKALQSIGYVGSSNAASRSGRDPEWMHINSIAYNPELDQVLLSVRSFSEIWIIDHGTTTREAAGHQGGRRGKGGDLLYRWGNPAAHGAGSPADRRLFAQHTACWIAAPLPGAGHLLVFNNGMGRPGGSYSSVDEIVPPLNDDGTYYLPPNKVYGPDRLYWSFTAPVKTAFCASLLSGAQRLANGNTLICEGMNGTLVEVTPQSEVVWQYVCPAVRLESASGAAHANQSAKQSAPSGASPLYRAYRYAASYAGLAGKKLVAGETIEEMERQPTPAIHKQLQSPK